MDDLWKSIAELGLELHPDRISVIADRISRLYSVSEFNRARSSFGPNTDQQIIESLHKAWKDATSLTPAEIAAALRGASAASKLGGRRGSVELVWTGPDTGLVAIRQTERVLCEVIESAKQRIFLVSFVAYEVKNVIQALRDAVAKQIRIDILLETDTKRGGKVSVDSLDTMKKLVPSASIYIWKNEDHSFDPGFNSGSVHAKCAIADVDMAFITSANLSSAAMERNMELGVLVRDGHLPDELARHLDALIAGGIIEKVT